MRLPQYVFKSREEQGLKNTLEYKSPGIFSCFFSPVLLPDQSCLSSLLSDGVRASLSAAFVLLH